MKVITKHNMSSHLYGSNNHKIEMEVTTKYAMSFFILYCILNSIVFLHEAKNFFIYRKNIVSAW